MEAVFLKILNMSITASWLVLTVIALRFLLKKAPKAFTVILWGLVGIRLILPFSFESVLSLIPSAETVPSNFTYSSIPEIDSGIGMINSAINPLISETLAPNEVGGVTPMEIVTLIAAIVWVTGIAAMLSYTLISYLRFRKKVREAAPLRENIYLCDGISTPFILGVIRPRIYLPSNVSEADAQHVIAHEMAHIKRRDHLWKPLGFLLLTIYWFNPVLWIAYILLCRDIELACDEKVIKDKGAQIKKSYSEALVNCSVPRKMIAACPLAFGEGSVKGRIKSVLNYKKPAFWIIIVSIIACISVAVCFLTNPIRGKMPKGFTIVESGSDIEGLSISVQDVELDTADAHLSVKWKNKSGVEIEYGCPYDILYLENGEYVSCAKTDLAFTLIAYFLGNGASTTVNYGLTEFDLTRSGSYRFIVKANKELPGDRENKDLWIDFEINSEVLEIESLRDKYPQFFDLNAENGLVVYVWQMSEYSYYCGLMSAKEYAYSNLNLLKMSHSGATVDEMKTILSSYDIPKSKIDVIAYQNPISSYISIPYLDYDPAVVDAYMYRLYEMLGLKAPEKAENTTPTEIPKLTILYNEPVNAWIGTYKWHSNESGLTYSDTKPILACVDYVEPIKVKAPYDSSGYSYGPYLNFEIKPDKVTVKCYDLDDDVRPQIDEYELNDDMTIIVNEGESRLFQIIAEWSFYEEFNGTIEYAFYT